MESRNFYFLVLISMECLGVAYGFMLLNRDPIQYEDLKKAADEAIAQEAKKKYDAPLVTASSSNLRSWFPFWNPYDTEIRLPSKSITTQTSEPEIQPSEDPLQPKEVEVFEVEIPVTQKPKNPIFHFPWNSRVSFPILTDSDIPRANRAGTRKLQGLSPKDKKPEKQYNPLCFFSALPCSSRKKGVYYVPRKDRN